MEFGNIIYLASNYRHKLPVPLRITNNVQIKPITYKGSLTYCITCTKKKWLAMKALEATKDPESDSLAVTIVRFFYSLETNYKYLVVNFLSLQLNKPYISY